MYMVVDCKENIIITVGYMYKNLEISCLKQKIIIKIISRPFLIY